MTAKPAALLATDRYAVMGVGAPSYTSGTHIWNGTEDILNPKPATMSITPRNRAWLPKDTPGSMEEPRRSNISDSWVVPVNPNVSTMPYRSTAELIALSSRNFTPASLERESRRKAARAASGSAVSSRAM